MFWDIELSPEDEELFIRKTADEIKKHGLEVAAIIMFEGMKPLSFLGIRMGRAFVSPFLPAFGDKISIRGEKFMQVFGKYENIDKLLSHLEKPEKKAKKKDKDAREPKTEKKWWQRFF